MEAIYIPHDKTGFFSALNVDYLAEKESLKPFYRYSPDDAGLLEAIEGRKKHPVDRALLVSVLRKQYKNLILNEAVSHNIDLLNEAHTFTICTAHQPNIMTGFLYFIYKIIHAAKLAQHLKAQHATYNFVPVFYIGSEDNDLEELGVFRYNGIKFKWETEQTGAVGRMATTDLQPLLQQLLALIGPPGTNAEQLKDLLISAYRKQSTIAAATRYIVNELLGTYGVVAIDADDAELKRAFAPIIKDEILRPVANAFVTQTSGRLNKQYIAQAYSRPINLFYLKDDLRERIEKTNDGWRVVRSNIKWSEASLKEEIENHPEHFSPNVILRGLYQETILPNIAFVGGGSEVAYWMQLKDVYDHYRVFFPALILRQSFLLEDKNASLLQKKTGLGDEEMFQPTEKLVRSFVFKHSQKDLQLEDIKHQLSVIFEQVKLKAVNIDITLRSSADAAITKMRHQLNTVEKKMVKAEKRNMATQLAHIYKLRNRLFPNESLQERYDTFMPYYLEMGDAFFEELFKHTLPYGNSFVILKQA
ncbi:MAG: bacillithiol biosynthesis cysteine-adding enzyme BshC [Edaphocola sp.]